MEKRKSMKVQIWESLEERGWVTPLSEPPDEFVGWWANHDHCRQRTKGIEDRWGWTGGITANKAWQCACYRDEFKERRYVAAAGTGINYAFFGWFKPFPRPRTSNPKFLAAHRRWCKAHNNPDPLDEPQTVPDYIKNAKSFADIKNILVKLAAKMDMNKAIGWTQARSDAANEIPP
jgi:hypothetical protein